MTPPLFSSLSTSKPEEGVAASDDATPTLLATLLGDVVQRWGQVTNLNGLLSSFCVFNDALSANNFAALHKKGTGFSAGTLERIAGWLD